MGSSSRPGLTTWSRTRTHSSSRSREAGLAYWSSQLCGRKGFWEILRFFSVIFLQASDQTKRLVCPGLSWPSRQTPLCSVHGKSPRGRDGRPARGGEGGYHSVPVLSFCQVLFNIFSCFVPFEVPASLISRPAYFSPSATRPSTTSALILRAQRFRWPLLWLNKIL